MSQTYSDIARRVVTDYYNDQLDTSNAAEVEPRFLSIDDTFIVWFSKTLLNWKALVGSNLVDGYYYEVTHNGNTNEIYLDVYLKQESLVIKD